MISRSLHLRVRSILKSSKNFKFWYFSWKRPKQIIFAQISQSSGGQVIISMKIMRAIYCLKNGYEQTYFFVDSSTWNSDQLTHIFFNLRNCTFSKIAAPRAGCFAPIYKNIEIFEIQKKNEMLIFERKTFSKIDIHIFDH